MVISFAFQTLLTALAGGLVSAGVVPHDAGSLLPETFIVLLPIALLSFQSAGQIVKSRFLGLNEIPTVVLTSTYCDIGYDPALLTAALTENAKRNRRVLSVFLLLMGALAGGFLSKGGEIEVALYVAAAIKLAITVVWVFWKSEGSIRLD